MSIFIFAVFHIRDSEYKIYDLESRTDRNYRVKPVLSRFLFQHLLFFLFFLALPFCSQFRIHPPPIHITVIYLSSTKRAYSHHYFSYLFIYGPQAKPSQAKLSGKQSTAKRFIHSSITDLKFRREEIL
jgi:hypothetical protein